MLCQLHCCCPTHTVWVAAQAAAAAVVCVLCESKVCELGHKTTPSKGRSSSRTAVGGGGAGGGYTSQVKKRSALQSFSVCFYVPSDLYCNTVSLWGMMGREPFQDGGSRRKRFWHQVFVQLSHKTILHLILHLSRL